MLSATLLGAALGTLSGASALLVPIVLPIAAAMRLTPPSMAAMFHAGTAAGLVTGPFTPPVVTIMGTAQIGYGEYLLSAGIPMAATVWLSERPLARAYRRAGWHAISESTRDDLVARGVPAQRIQVIHPGVDSARFTPGGARAAQPTFLYVGRLKRYKGIDLAIRALAVARRSRPELRLEVAGTGDYRAALEQLAASLGQAEAVTFHGFVSEAEKLGLLRSAWANVFPSPKEGWGITVVEAAACGTPSLASDSPGLRDSVRHGETGYLVPHGDVEVLATRMLELAGDPALVARLGAGARAFAESLTWERTADDAEAQLHAIIAGRA